VIRCFFFSISPFVLANRCPQSSPLESVPPPPPSVARSLELPLFFFPTLLFLTASFFHAASSFSHFLSLRGLKMNSAQFRLFSGSPPSAFPPHYVVLGSHSLLLPCRVSLFPMDLSPPFPLSFTLPISCYSDFFSYSPFPGMHFLFSRLSLGLHFDFGNSFFSLINSRWIS